MNARFWVFCNGDYVKLTLRPDDELCWSREGVTEERGFSKCVQWAFDGVTVFYEHYIWERDCDGVCQSHTEAMADLRELAMVEAWDTPGLLLPDWRVYVADRRARHG